MSETTKRFVYHHESAELSRDKKVNMQSGTKPMGATERRFECVQLMKKTDKRIPTLPLSYCLQGWIQTSATSLQKLVKFCQT